MIHPFFVRGRHYVLDVESGAVHLLDKHAYDVLLCREAGEDAFALPYPREETAQVLQELAQLEGEGLLHARPLTLPRQTGEPVIKAMCLHIAHDCNLRCKYCFAETGGFGGPRSMMSKEVARAALEFLIAHSGNRVHLEVDLFGGEPLMNWPVVQETVACGRELERLHGKKIAFTITTNGLMLDAEKIRFINQEMHNVVISIDGRRDVHNALRPLPNGQGSYDAILPRARALVLDRGEGEHYVRGTFTNRSLDFTRDVEALVDQGFRQISLEPVVLDEDSPYAITQEHLPRIFREYDKLADLQAESRGTDRWFNFFHFMLDLDNGPCLKKKLLGCGAGAEYVAVAPEGAIYPCHQFVGMPEFVMGHVLTGEFDAGRQSQFTSCNVRTKASCYECWAKYFCSGGCAASAYKYNKDIFVPHKISCALERKRTELAIALYLEEKEQREADGTQGTC